MLTISQLAAYAGVSVRAVRHYHQKGLLPEPRRDHSGYRRYDARAVVELIRIGTLTGAGVPLSRVRELLAAEPAEFAAAIEDIDRRLRAEIRERHRHRDRIAQLAAGDSLALPPEAVAYFDRMRELGFREEVIEIERDSWILIAAQVPDQVPALLAVKRPQIEDERLRALYHDIGELVDCTPDDPRLPRLADRVAVFIEAAATEAERAQAHRAEVRCSEVHGGLRDAAEAEQELSDDLVELLDSAFVDCFPCASRLLELLEERGWTGWTMIRRVEPAQPCAMSTNRE